MPFDPLQIGTQISVVGAKLESRGDKLVTSSNKLLLIADALESRGQLVSSLQTIKTGASETRTFL